MSTILELLPVKLFCYCVSTIHRYSFSHCGLHTLVPAVDVVSGDLVGSDGVNFATGSNLASAMVPLVSLIEGS